MRTPTWRRRLAVAAASLALGATTLMTGVAPSSASASTAGHRWSAGCGQASPVEPGTSTTRHISIDGLDRTYVVHVPEHYHRWRPTPVILAFHGRKSTGAEMEAYSGLSRLPAIVAYPDGLPDDEGKTGWEGAPYAPGADDIGLVKQLLDRFGRDFCVNGLRVYATGKSNGGGFTALLACQLPHRIAAFAPVAGAFYPQSAVGCRTSPPVPMLEFHGTADTIMEYEGGTSHGEDFPSIPAWLQGWVRHDHCRHLTETTIGDDVERLAWSRCAGRTEVVHYRINGGGHTWPGELEDSGPGSSTQTISATEVMWSFFQQHPLRP